MIPTPSTQLSATLTSTLRLLLLAMAPALLGGVARADELRLDDGRVLVGKVEIKTRNDQKVYEIQTRDGLVVVPGSKVLDHFTDAQLRQRLADTKKSADSTAFSYLQLAIDAHSYGLEPEMWRNLDIAIEKQADKQQASAAVARRLQEFLAELEPEILDRRWRSADTATRVHKLMQQIKIADEPSRLLAIQELLTREPNADAALRKEARSSTLEYRRIAALEALARRARNEQGQSQNQQYRFVLRTTILDASDKVREAAARIVRDHEQATTAAVEYLAPGLVHQNAKVRIRTAEAYAELGSPAAIPQLVMAGPTAGVALAPGDGGGGARAHIAILQQQAYIRDFDVEVAQAAFIADPKVDVLQSGVVLDVNVAGVFEERVIVRAYRQAIKRLAGSDPGSDPRGWADWYAERQARAAATATTPGGR